ncbi:hypothetical protein V8E53_001460 [Lactarius tabidus]
MPPPIVGIQLPRSKDKSRSLRFRWRERLSRSLPQIAESDTSLSVGPSLMRVRHNLATDSDSLLESSNTTNVTCFLPNLQIETPNITNTSFPSTDSSLQSHYPTNTSLISTDSSLQSYHTANASFISADSSLQSCYTANSSFISTDSLHQSYYTADTSLSSRSTIYSTSSLSSDVSLPYSVKSVNSYKSRKTVLYRRREHPPPVAFSEKNINYVTE